MARNTHELLLVALVLDLDDRLVVLLVDLEWPVLHVLLDVGLLESATNETLGVKDSIPGVGVVGVLSGISNSVNETSALR